MINLNIQSDKNRKRKKEKSLQLKKVLLKSIMLFRANFIRESDSFYSKFFGSSFSCHKVQMQNGKKKKTVEQGAKSFSSLTGLLLRKKEPSNQGFIFPPARKNVTTLCHSLLSSFPHLDLVTAERWTKEPPQEGRFSWLPTGHLWGALLLARRQQQQRPFTARPLWALRVTLTTC